MTFIFKASRFTQRQWILHGECFKRDSLISLGRGFMKQKDRALVQPRFYSSEERTPEKRVRLYNGTLKDKIRFVKIFSLSTSAASILIQPYIISKVSNASSPVSIGGIVFSFGLFAFLTPVLLHMIIKKYVIHIDYNPIKDTYIATTYSIFVRKKELEFRPEDVHLPTMSEMLTSCVIKGDPLFIDVHSFTDLDHYKRIMGFDKPMDFSLNPDIKSKKN